MPSYIVVGYHRRILLGIRRLVFSILLDIIEVPELVRSMDWPNFVPWFHISSTIKNPFSSMTIKTTCNMFSIAEGHSYLTLNFRSGRGKHYSIVFCRILTIYPVNAIHNLQYF